MCDRCDARVMLIGAATIVTEEVGALENAFKVVKALLEPFLTKGSEFEQSLIENDVIQYDHGTLEWNDDELFAYLSQASKLGAITVMISQSDELDVSEEPPEELKEVLSKIFESANTESTTRH